MRTQTSGWLGIWLLLACPAAVADIYSFVDSEGGVHLSNIQNDKRYRPLISDNPSPRMNLIGAALIEPVDLAVRKARFERLIERIAQRYQLESALLHALITVESRYNPAALSPRGAQGLMQLMPATARRYGVVNAFDPEQNVRGGAQYLRDLLALFDRDVDLAVAAYNAGENAVIRYGNRIPPYRETGSYVPKVMDYYRRYQRDR